MTPDPFAMVPEELLAADVSAQAIRLYAVLDRFAGRRGVCWPSRAALAARLRTRTEETWGGASVELVKRSMGELIEAGFVLLERNAGPGGVNRYRLPYRNPQAGDDAVDNRAPRVTSDPPRHNGDPRGRVTCDPRKENQGTKTTKPPSPPARPHGRSDGGQEPPRPVVPRPVEEVLAGDEPVEVAFARGPAGVAQGRAALRAALGAPRAEPTP